MLARTFRRFEGRVHTEIARIGCVDKVARAGTLRAVDQGENPIVVDAAQTVVFAVRHGSSSAQDGVHACASRRQGFRFGEISVENFGVRRSQRSSFLMVNSTAHYGSY